MGMFNRREDVEQEDIELVLATKINDVNVPEDKRRVYLQILERPVLTRWLARRASRKGVLVNAERDWAGFADAIVKILEALMPLILKLLEFLPGLFAVKEQPNQPQPK